MWKTFYIRIFFPRTSTPPGIKHGIRGRLLTLTSLVIWRRRRKIEHQMRIGTPLLHTSYKPLMVSRMNIPSKMSSLDQPFAGFFRSIALRNEEALQDILRLLTLWFKYGSHDDVSHAMANGFTTVEVDTWLEVIPQVSTSPRHYHKLIINVDYRTNSNASCQYSANYQQSSGRGRKTSSTSTHIPPCCGFQVL
jgi:hypothetical protein